MSRKTAFQAMDISLNTFIIFAEIYYELSKLMLCFYVLKNKAILYHLSCLILLINVQATRSKPLGTHYTHSQAYFKTWMDIITLVCFCSRISFYYFVTCNINTFSTEVYLSTDKIIFYITNVFFVTICVLQ